MTNFYEISNYGIEQHITLALPGLCCLFNVRIIWPYSAPLLFMRDFGLEVWLSLHKSNAAGSRRK